MYKVVERRGRGASSFAKTFVFGADTSVDASAADVDDLGAIVDGGLAVRHDNDGALLPLAQNVQRSIWLYVHLRMLSG